MKLLRRNLTEFEYLPYVGPGDDLNEFGEHTGDFSDEGPQYGDPVPYKGNISAPSGKTNQTFYGEDIRYTHTLLMEDPDVDINEYGIIRWKGKLFDIVSVKPSINSVSIALRRQTEDNPDTESVQP